MFLRDLFSGRKRNHHEKNNKTSPMREAEGWTTKAEDVGTMMLEMTITMVSYGLDGLNYTST